MLIIVSFGIILESNIYLCVINLYHFAPIKYGLSKCVNCLNRESPNFNKFPAEFPKLD